MSLAEPLSRLRSLLRRSGAFRLRGVKAAAFDPAGRVLLVRHRYGDRAAWMLPGGGVRPWERPLAAAARELAEETGCRLGEPYLVARFRAGAGGAAHPLFLFAGTTGDRPVPDGREVADAAFFDPAALPAGTSPATRRRLGELAAGGPFPADW